MRSYTLGQVLWGKIRFKDGCFPEYNRPYLIVQVNEDSLGILNVSSIGKKFTKLRFPSNLKIIKYRPPLREPSFVKLDSFVTVKVSDVEDLYLMDNGTALDNDELKRILQALEDYRSSGTAK